MARLRRLNGRTVPVGVIRKRSRRRVRQREKKHIRRDGERRWHLSRARDEANFVVVLAPQSVAIHDDAHRGPTLALCGHIRRRLILKKQDLIVDFSHTAHLHATGMLALMAELDRAIRMTGGRRTIRCRLPSRKTERGKIVGQTFDQIGLFELIKQAPPVEHATESFDESVRHWRYATGTRIDERPGDVLDKHEGRIAPAVMEGMQKGLAEAIVNSLHHAYAEPREDGCAKFGERRWWMFTHEKDGMLSVIVCDLGIGIPRSLPLNWSSKLLRSIAGLFEGDAADVVAIKSALELGKSRTGAGHRGKGLPQIWSATQNSKNGTVGIHSNRGYVGTTNDREDISRSFRERFMGTLVWWRVPTEAAIADGRERDQHS
ncbi:hypothetical protein [Sphingomonas pruni]|uniref:hypothetical protein n=1 Tax=Sphingomonas pruni TaxID=40683 RepID=UPI000AEAAAC0|nr:hypothetical protein [Sphingomonas pruni]